MQFRRFIAALCAASIAFTQTAILPISAFAAESDISAVQTLADGGDDGNAVGDADSDGGADIGGDINGGDADENGDDNNGDADDNNGDVGGNGGTDGDDDANVCDSDDNGEADDADDNADDDNKDNNDDSIDTYSDAGSIDVDRAHFPDSEFRSYVSENFDTDNDGVLSDSEIAAVKDVEFLNQRFENMEGIEYFTQLDALRISGLDISEIDVSKNTNLRSFDAVNCGMLERVVLPEGLAVLSIDYCPVSEMDLTSLTELESLAVNSINIHSFDLSSNTMLTTLDIRDTTLTDGIDISANTALKTLVLSNCGLTSVDLSANKALTNVNLSKNSLAAVDLTNCTAASVTLATHGNTMNIGVVDGEYDLKNLADYGLDVSRMLHISGAKLKDSTLYDFEGDTVTYNYDTGRGEATFNLKAEKVLNNGYYVYPDYDSYINNENGVSCAAWSDVVKAMTDRNSDYYIVLRRDVTEQNITFPTTTKSFTLVSSENGEAKTLTIANSALTLPVNTSFVNVKIESTAANGFTVTANKDLEISGFFSDTLTALNGTASSKLTVKQHEKTEDHYDISYAISKFGTLSITGDIVFCGNTDVTNLEFEDEAKAYITTGTFTVTNIKTVGMAYFVYVGDSFSPVAINGTVTLGGIGDPIQLVSCTDDILNNSTFTNGAVLVNMKTADTSAFVLSESCRPSEDSTLIRSGSQIRVGEPTFELKYGDKTETFSFWDDLIAYINANPQPSGSYVSHYITVLKDADIGSFTMPQKGKYYGLFIKGEDQSSPKQLKFSGDIELTGQLQVTVGVQFVSKDDGYKIKMNGHGVISTFNSTLSDALTEVYDDNKGAASSSFCIQGDSEVKINYAVNNIGSLTVGENTVFNNTVNVRTLEAATPLYIVNKAAVTVQDIYFSGTDNKVIAYTTDDFVPVTITGTANADITFALVDSSDHSVYKKFENGQTLLISSSVALTDLSLADECKPSENVTFVRNGSEVKLSEAKYVITFANDGMATSFSFALWSDVLNFINNRAVPTAEYNVTVLNNDDIGGAFVMPKAGTYSLLTLSGSGKEIRFTGNLTLTGKVDLHNIALESNKAFTITTSYELGIVGLASSTLTAVNGSGKNDLSLYGSTYGDPDNVSFEINKFNNVNISNKVRLADTLKATNLVFASDAVLYTGKNDVTVTNIVNTRGTICYESEFTPVSVTGKIILGETADKLKIKAETPKFANNTTVLVSKTADISAMAIDADSASDDSTLAKIGSEIKVMTQAFKVSHMDANKKNFDDGKFALWSDVLAVINDGTADYEIELLDNADINGAFTMPKAGTFGSLMISGGVFRDQTLTFTGNIVLTGETTFYNIGLESVKNGKPASFTITANYDLSLTSVKSNTLTAIKGSAKSALSLYGNDTEVYPTEVNAPISGFGKVTVYGHIALTNTVKATDLVLDDGSSVQIYNNAVSFTNVTADGSAQIIYRNDNGTFKPMTVTGDIIGGDNSSITIAYSDGSSALIFDNNTTVLTANKADLSKLKISNNCVPDTQGSVEYILVRVGSDVKVMPAAFKLTHFDTANVDDGTYALWSDVLAKIAETAKTDKDKDFIYTIELLADADIGGAFTMPKAGTYRSIAFNSVGDNEFTLKFTGNVTATGNMYFGYIRLESQKNGSPADFTISTKYNISINELRSDTLTAINGSAKSVINFYQISTDWYDVDYAVNNFDKVYIERLVRFNNTVKTKDLSLCAGAFLLTGKNSITAENILVTTTATIAYTTPDFTPVTVTGEIIVDRGTLEIALFDSDFTAAQKFELNTTVLTAKKADISNIKIADDSVPAASSSVKCSLIRTGSDVKIMPAAFKLSHLDIKTMVETDDGTFVQWSDVLAKINENAKTNNKLYHIVHVLCDADIDGAFTMPKAGTYNALRITNEGDNIPTLKFTGNITTTGYTELWGIRLESQKKVKNGFAPANYTITAGNDYLSIDIRSDTLTSINGSAESKLIFVDGVNSKDVNFAINKFGAVMPTHGTEFKNTVNVDTLDLGVANKVYMGTAPVTVKNIRNGQSTIHYTTKDFKPLNVTGDVTLERSDTPLTFALVDGDDHNSYQRFNAGTTVLTSKTVDLSKIKVADDSIPEKQNNESYTLVRSGSDVKIMPAAFKLSHLNLATGTDIDDGTFAQWSDVLTKIDEMAKTDNNLYCTVSVLCDADIGGAFTMPKAGTYTQLVITNEGNNIPTLKFTGNITITGLTTIYGIRLESQKKVKNDFVPANYTITVGNDYMLMIGIRSDTLTAINGSAKSKLRFMYIVNSSNDVNFAINKFGTVIPARGTEFKNTVNVDTLDLGWTDNVYMGTAPVTVKNIINNKATIYYTTKDFKPLNVTGDITLEGNCLPLAFALVDGDNYNSYQRFNAGTTVLTSKTADLSKIKVTDASLPETNGSVECSLIRVGSDVKIMPEAFKLYMDVGDGENSYQGTYALWSDVLAKIAENAKNDKTRTYRVMVLADTDIGGAFTMPPANTYKKLLIGSGNAAAIRFTGNIKTTGITGFSNIRLESQKMGKNGYEPADFTITSNYEMGIDELYSDTLKAINGSAKSTMMLTGGNGELPDATVDYAVNNFGKVTIDGYVVLNNTVKTTTLDLNYSTLFTGKNSVTAVDIVARPNSLIVYTTPEFTPVTVTGDITSNDGCTPLVLGLADISEGISYQKFEPNTTVLTAKKADISNIRLIDASAPASSGNAEYSLVRVGSDVKIMPEAFNLSHYDNGTVNDGTYALWSDVLAKIAEVSKTDKGLNYTVELLADAEINGAFTMPKAGTYGSIKFDSYDSNIRTLKFTGNVTATGDIILGNIKLESQKNGSPASFTISTKYDMTIDRLRSETLTAINGSSKSKIGFGGAHNELYAVDYAVNNFDYVNINYAVKFNNTVKIKNLLLVTGSTLLTGKNSITAENIIVPMTATIAYITPDFTPVTVTGEIIAENSPLQIALSDSDFTSYQKFEPNTTVLTAKKADISNVKIDDNSTPEKQGDENYTLARVGSDVKIMPAAFMLYHYEDHDTPRVVEDGTYALWSDVLAKIDENAKTDKGLSYTVKLLADTDIGGAFTMPKAGTYGGIGFYSDGDGDDEFTLKFTGNVITTGYTHFENIRLESQKNGSPANFTITSNYYMEVAGFSSETLTAVNGSSKANFGVTKSIVGYAVNNFNAVYAWDTVEFKNTVKTANLYIDFDSTVYTGKNSITASNIITSKEDSGSLVYTTPDFTPVTVTGDIIGEPLPIALVDGDDHTSYQKFEPNTTVLVAKKADLSNIKIADSSAPEKQGEADYTLARVDSDVKIMPAAFELLIDEGSGDYSSQGTYALWSDVLARIAENAKTDKTLNYHIRIMADVDINGAFTMPPTNTYASLIIQYGIDGSEEDPSTYPTVRFAGNIKTTGATSFINIRLESQKNGKPADFTIMSNYDLEISGLYSDTLKAINGLSRSTIVIQGGDSRFFNDYVTYAINNFGRVTINGYVKLNNTVKTTTLDLNTSVLLTGKNSITAENISVSNSALIVYTTPDFTPVTITGDNIGDLPLVLALADIGESVSYQKFEPNTTVLTAKKADLSKIKIADESAPEKQGDADYTLARVGSDVKIMPAAFKLSHYNDVTVDDGTYALWSDVLAKIDEVSKTNKELTHSVELLSDAEINGTLTMPKAGTYGEIQFDSAGDNEFTLKFTGNVVTTGYTYFGDIKLESQKNGSPSSFTITSNYNMSVGRLHSDTLTAINGSTKSRISFFTHTRDMSYVADYAVNNFDSVSIDCYIKFNNTVKTKHLSLGSGAALITGKNSITAESISNALDAFIIYTTPDFTPVTVTGQIIVETFPLKIALFDSDLTSYQKFEPNTTVLTAKKADLSKIKIADNSLPEKQGDAEYTLARVGSDVKIMPEAFELAHTNYDEAGWITDGTYALWSDVLAKIAENAKEKKNKEATYGIVVHSDADLGGAFTMPKAGTYKILQICGENDSNIPTVKFTGNIALTGSVVFSNIRLESQKKTANGFEPANYTITTGNYDLTIDNFSSDTLTAINGSSRSTLIVKGMVVPFAVNKFRTVMPFGYVEFKNTVSADVLDLLQASNVYMGTAPMTVKNVINVYEQIISYTTKDFTPLTVTGDITLYNENSSPLAFALVDGEDHTSYQRFKSNTTVLTSKTADIANMKIADDSLPEGSAKYTLARVGSDVKIMPEAFKLSHFDQQTLNYIDDGTYAFWADVLAEIAVNAKAAPTVTHKVELLDNVDLEGTFTMPKAGTYGGLRIVGNGKMLCFTGNITTTGKIQFENIDLESLKNGTPADFTITANGQLIISKLLSRTLTAINGSANSEISFASDLKTPYIADYAVNSLGIVSLGGSTGFTNTVKANDLFIGSGAILYTGKNSITASKLTADGALIAYTTPDFTPVNVTGEVVPCEISPLEIALVNGSIYDPDPFQKFKPNTTVLKAKTADVSKIKLNVNSAPDENSTLVKVGSDIKIETKAFTVTADDVNGEYTQWSDVLNAIAANAKAGNGSADYTVKVASNYDMGGTFKMPAANTYGSLALTADSEKTLTFTGDLTLTGVFSVSNVVLSKKASATDDTVVPVNVNIGKYSFEIGENASVSPDANGYSRLSGVSGTGEFRTAGNVAATGSINVGTMCIVGCDISFSGSAASFSGKLSVQNEIGGNHSSFSYDKALAKNICFDSMEQLSGGILDFNVKNVELGDILASIKGDFISSKIADSDLFTARSDNYLVAVNNDNFVNFLIQGKSSSDNYDTLANAVKGIERHNNASNSYSLIVRSEHEQPFALPKAGTYNSITINGSTVADVYPVLTTETDLVFSGSIVLTTLTLNKVNSNGEAVPVNMTVNGDLDLKTISLSRDTETGLNRIGNITGTGSIQLLDDTFIGGNADINIAPYKRIVLGENASFTGSIAPQGSDAVLEYPASVGKNITLTGVTSPLNIKVSDVKAGDVLAKLDYEYTEGDIIFENEDGLVAVQSGNELVAEQAAVSVTDNKADTTKFYYTFEDAAKGIESINDKNADYTINVSKSQQFVSPKAGSYDTLKIMGQSINTVLTTEDDLSVSGNMTLYYVTLNKVDSDGRVVPISINFDNERNSSFVVDETAQLSYNSDIKKDCIADVNGGENSQLGIINNTMISGNVNIAGLVFLNSCTVAFGDDASFTGELSTEASGEQVLEYSSDIGYRIKINDISSNLKLVLNVSGVQEGEILAEISNGYIEGNITLRNNDDFVINFMNNVLVAAKP